MREDISAFFAGGRRIDSIDVTILDSLSDGTASRPG
jgi:hypothetical protein